MYAVLEDALLCFKEKLVVGMPHGQRHRAQQAEKWFFSEDRHSLYSFAGVCDGLSLDAADIRDKLGYLEQDTRGKKITNKKQLHRSQQRLVIARGLPGPRNYRAHWKEPL